MSEELIKCRVEDGRIVVPCYHLEEEVDGFAPAGKARGLYQWTFTNRKTGAQRILFGLKTAKSPKGIIFNYCPWCGADLTAAQPQG